MPQRTAPFDPARSCEELISEVGKLLAHLVFSELSPKADQLIMNSPQMLTALSDMNPQQRQIVKGILKQLSTQNKSISRAAFTQMLLINGNTLKKFNITHDLLLFDGCFYEVIQAASKYAAGTTTTAKSSSQTSHLSSYPQSIIDQLNQLKTRYLKSKRLSDIIAIPAHSILRNKSNNSKQQSYQHIHYANGTITTDSNNTSNTNNSPILLADLHAFIHRNKSISPLGNTISNTNLKGQSSLLGLRSDLQAMQQHNKESSSNLPAEKLALSPSSSSSSPRQANRVPLLHLTRDKQPSIESAMLEFQQQQKQQQQQEQQLSSLTEEIEQEPIQELTRGYSNYLKYTKSIAKIATQSDSRDNLHRISQQFSSPGKSLSPEYKRHQQIETKLFDGIGYLELKRAAQTAKLQQTYHHYQQPQHSDSTTHITNNNNYSEKYQQHYVHMENNQLQASSPKDKLPSKIGRSLLEMKPNDYYPPHSHHNKAYSPTIQSFVKAYENRLARMISSGNKDNNESDENDSSYDYYMNAFGEDSDVLNNLSGSSDSQQQLSQSKFLSRPRQEQPIMQLHKSFLAGNLSDKTKEYLLKLEEAAMNNENSIRSSQLGSSSRTSSRAFTLRPYLKTSDHSKLRSKINQSSRQNTGRKDEGSSSSNGENTIRSSGSKSLIQSQLKSDRSSHSNPSPSPRSYEDSNKNTPPDSSRKNPLANHISAIASITGNHQHTVGATANGSSSTTHHGILGKLHGTTGSSSPPTGHATSNQSNTSTPSHAHGILNSKQRENTTTSSHSISSYAIQILKPINAMKQSGKLDHNPEKDKEQVKGAISNNNSLSNSSSFYEKKKLSRNKKSKDDRVLSPEKTQNSFKSSLSAFMQKPAVELLPEKAPPVEQKIVRPIFERTSKSYRDFLQGMNNSTNES